MAFPTKRQLITGPFVIDNGDGAPLLDSCPCCGLTLTETGADAVLRVIAKNGLTFGQALELATLMRAKRQQ
jgi:hypothetical protein